MSDQNFAQRMQSTIEKAGGDTAMARATGINRSSLISYRKGQSEPTLSKLVLVARAGGVSVEWLATGSEQQESSDAGLGVAVPPAPGLIDIPMLVDIAEGLETVNSRQGLNMNCLDLIGMAARTYNLLNDPERSSEPEKYRLSDTVDNLEKLVRDQLNRKA
ncbi:helix-turn-helix domain-containing protein [Kiloniella sp. b19]|uniref:helix-turn-helix domain-containing protein n=1 Tax=Kiloniella sp. GXU_MW_B19 TaxID=3141326 RepID=UPI0031DEC69E